LAFDITNRTSFESLPKWIDLLEETAPNNVVLSILGNKIDLIDKQAVFLEEALAFSQQNNAIFNFTSAKDDQGVDDSFD
jgi:GTPase SAR1 family protein